MTLRLKIGTVKSKADVTRTGVFQVAFKLDQTEDVRYVTPYGNSQQGFIAIPPAGSQVLCLYEDSVNLEGDELRGNFYIGSVMGAITGLNKDVPLDISELPQAAEDFISYVEKDKPGLAGPNIPEGMFPEMTEDQKGAWPRRFQDMYDGKGITPEAIGITNNGGDAFKISERYNSTERSKHPFQDFRVGIMSGNGKRIEAVDSPIVDGIVMTNEHRGKDFFIWSSGMSAQSPFAQGEYHMRTHGPVNMYTLMNRFHIWVEDGLNVEIENKSTSSKSYGGGVNCDGRTDGAGNPSTGLGNPGTGGYKASRQGVFGNQSTGCIQLLSHHNNISVMALEQDSVVYVNTPGPHSKVIVESGGTVDIVANKKITLQSDLEVEINAPLVQINGSTEVEINGQEVDINGGTVHIDGGPNIFLNDLADGAGSGGYTP